MQNSFIKNQNIIAVTGTNGKSSVADFFHQILTFKQNKCSYNWYSWSEKKFFKKGVLTSPDAISLHKELYELKKKKLIMF